MGPDVGSGIIYAAFFFKFASLFNKNECKTFNAASLQLNDSDADTSTKGSEMCL